MAIIVKKMQQTRLFEEDGFVYSIHKDQVFLQYNKSADTVSGLTLSGGVFKASIPLSEFKKENMNDFADFEDLVGYIN